MPTIENKIKDCLCIYIYMCVCVCVCVPFQQLKMYRNLRLSLLIKKTRNQLQFITKMTLNRLIIISPILQKNGVLKMLYWVRKNGPYLD